MTTYQDYKSQVSSEKITLAVIQAAKRLVAFTLHSGSVYKIENFDVAVIQSINEAGIGYTEVNSVGAVTTSSYYHDRDGQTLYLRTSDSTDPNAKFIHLVQKLFFSNAPITLPHDLDNGFEVYWEPSIQKTSNFGSEIDTVDQASEAIDGSGSLALFNDHDFWASNFDKLFFENQLIEVYSYNRDLPVTEARLIYRGRVESKSYSNDVISFKLKDIIAQLKDAIELPNISELGARNAVSFASAKQRMILGKKKNHLPVNIDSLIDNSYPVTGTVALSFGTATLTGTGTEFLKELSPNDRLKIAGLQFTVGSITSDTVATLTSNWTTGSESGLSIEIIPASGKRWINRVWNIAGHPLREPTTTTIGGSTIRRIRVVSTRDFTAGDKVWFGSPHNANYTIDRVLSETAFIIEESLITGPNSGVTITRPCVQKVKIDDVELEYDRDFTVDATTATLTLNEDAELNASPTLESVEQATFTNASRAVTGSGTSFKSFLKPGYAIRPKGTIPFYEILAVNSDTSLTLRTAFAGSTETDYLQYKDLILDPKANVFHMEVMGKTVDGTTSGILPKTASQIILMLLKDAGLEAELDESSFVDDFSPEEIALVIPQKVSDKKTATYRDVINDINRSNFGLLYQNNDFQLTYGVIRPQVTTNMVRLDQSDILEYKISSTNKNMLRKSTVEYDFKEYEESTKESVTETVDSQSEISEYILNTSREKIFESSLVNEQDAQRLANRWKFLLEFSTNKIELTTKLQTIDLQINDIIQVDLPKMFTRYGGSSSKRIFLIESVKKSGSTVEITGVDLSNAFNRVALISDTELEWSESSEETRLISGYISDANGLIDNNEDSFGTNQIW